jgi:hypothetical protein
MNILNVLRKPWSLLERQYNNIRSNHLIKSAQGRLQHQHLLPHLFDGRTDEIMPPLGNLINLYDLIKSRRPRTVLEFGVGYSTIIIATALRDNLDDFGIAGHLYTVDSEDEWLENTSKKLDEDVSRFVTLSSSTIEAVIVDHTLCHRYKNLPNISPNFVLIDGPDPQSISGDRNGLNFSSGRPVVGIDVLLYESTAPNDFFILLDGRWENARLLKRKLNGDYRFRRHPSLSGYRKTFYTLEYTNN